MEYLKPWLGRFLQAPNTNYVMNFVQFLEIDLLLQDLDQGDINNDLLDEKKDKKDITPK